MNYELFGDDSVVIPGHDKNAILDYLESTYPPPQYVDRDGWETFYNTFMPLYIEAITKKGYAPYHPQQSYDLLKYMIDTTGDRMGLPTAFMMALYDLSQIGAINNYVWNPALYPSVVANKPKSGFDKTIEDIGKGISDTVGGGFNKILFTAGVVGIIYLLGKSVLTGGIKLPSRRKD
jgi:hypothetical protein